MSMVTAVYCFDKTDDLNWSLLPILSELVIHLITIRIVETNPAVRAKLHGSFKQNPRKSGIRLLALKASILIMTCIPIFPGPIQFFIHFGACFNLMVWQSTYLHFLPFSSLFNPAVVVTLISLELSQLDLRKTEEKEINFTVAEIAVSHFTVYIAILIIVQLIIDKIIRRYCRENVFRLPTGLRKIFIQILINYFYHLMLIPIYQAMPARYSGKKPITILNLEESCQLYAGFTILKFGFDIYLELKCPPSFFNFEDPLQNINHLPSQSNQQYVLKIRRVSPTLFRDSQNIELSLGENEPLDSSNQTNTDSDKCIVCQVNESNCLVLQCYHSGFCRTCAVKLATPGSTCILCRGPADVIAVIEKIDDNSYRVIEEL